jgi:signal transduction histidine kinase
MTHPGSHAASDSPPRAFAEALRLETLRGYSILDTPQEAAFDDITRIAAHVCQAPIALISLVDRDRQWFKSVQGLDVRQTPIEQSVCAHAILQDGLFVVEDTAQDRRFADNPLVTGHPHMRFYAGALLKTPDGVPLGTVCVLDTQPRQLDAAQTETLLALARQTMAQMELRRLLAQAQEASHYRAKLMAIAGHDLKTPLRAAAYAVEKLRRSASEEQRPILDSARDHLGQIGRQFQELATIAVAGTEQARPSLGPLSLNEVLAAVLSNWQRLAGAKGLQLRHVPTSLVVQSHRALLSTLIGNLVGNAVKYTEEGRVLVGCRRRGDRVLIEVIDTGIGLDQDDTDKIFNAFRQADPRSEGLGVGLWIVHSTAQTLGYPVHVQSRKGVGSRFSVSVPLAGAQGGAVGFSGA